MKTIARNGGAIALTATLLVFGAMVLRGPKGIPALTEKHKEIQVLQDENASLSAENLRKRSRIERLKNSRSALEFEVREKLKRLKADEVQLITPEVEGEVLQDGSSASSTTP